MASEPETTFTTSLRALQAELRDTLRQTLETTRQLRAAAAEARRSAIETCEHSRRLVAERRRRRTL